MLSGLKSYIKNLKNRINNDYLSPMFVRLANLYYHDGQYEESINVCNIGLQIYPDYYTAKLILLKSLLKLEYLTAAEPIIIELENKFPDIPAIHNLNNDISKLKKSFQQEKIYYSNKINNFIEFDDYAELFFSTLQIINESNLDDSSVFRISNYDFNMDEFDKFQTDFSNIKLKDSEKNKLPETLLNNIKLTESDDSFFDKFKFITETLADLLASQKYFKEAFEAYNLLLQKEGINKRRIQEKLNSLERNF